GLRDLVLVDPVADVAAHQARMLAANGVAVLDAARVVPDFATAVADCGMVLATAGETAGTRRETVRGTPAELFPRFAEALRHGPARQLQYVAQYLPKYRPAEKPETRPPSAE